VLKGPAAGGVNHDRRLGTFTAICIISGLLHCLSVTPTLLYTMFTNRHLIHFATDNDEILMEYFKNRTFTSSALFLRTMAISTLYLNNSLNFYVYCLIGKSFRQDCMSLVKGIRKTHIRSRT
jgi:hypothetical protein